mgnify:CR=1 FL=1
MPKRSQPTVPPSERAFLVGVQLRDDDHLFTVEDSLAELALLSDTAGMEVVGAAVALAREGGVPTPLALDDAASFSLPDREVQP